MVNKLLDYKEKGLLYSQVHPTLDLTIWNYTDAVSYLDLWDDLLIRCRGLVTNSKGEIVNNPIDKFFNYNEERGKAVCNFNEPFECFTKYDGSLIMAFKYDNQIVICSRGSFTSDQANWASQIFYQNYYNLKILTGFTYCFELIHPYNRIVVQYTEKKLVLLEVRHHTNNETKLDWFKDDFIIAEKHKFDIKSHLDFERLTKQNLENQEGFVFKFKKGRCKVKFEDYVRLHHIVTNISTTTIWNCLKNKDDLNTMLKDIPDEIFSQIKTYIDSLYFEFRTIENQCKIHVDVFSKMKQKYMEEGREEDLVMLRKQLANMLYTMYRPVAHIAFLMFDEKDYDNAIWDLLKPKYKKL